MDASTDETPGSRVDRRSVLKALGASGIALASPLVDRPVASSHGSEWPTEGYDDANTRHNPDALGPTANPSTEWTESPDEREEFAHSSPVVADGTVYIGSTRSRGGQLYAIDAESGNRTWTTGELFFESVHTTPTVAEGQVIFGHTNGILVSKDPASGSENWRTDVEGTLRTAPAVADGTVYVGTNDGSVHGVRASDGHRLWAYDTGAENPRQKVEVGPAVHDGTVYVTTNGYDTLHVYAFNASDARMKWKRELVDVGNAEYYLTAPTVANDTLYVGDWHSNALWALDPATGEDRWRIDGLVLGPNAGPAVADCRLYGAARDGTLYSWDAATGDFLWSLELGNRFVAAPAVANGVLYVGDTDGRIHARDASSARELWTEDLGGEIRTAPAVADGTVYVATTQTLHAIDGDTEDRRESVDLGSCPNGTRVESFVRGSVETADADPVTDATVDLILTNGTVVATTQTDADGSFGPVEVDPVSELTAEVDQPEYSASATTVDVGPGETKVINVVLEPRAIVRGSVTYEDGRAAAGVPVTLVNADTGTTVATVETYQTGEFGPITVAPATLTARVDIEGRSTVADTVTVAQGESKTIEVVLTADGETTTDGTTATGPGFGVGAALAGLAGGAGLLHRLQDDESE